MDFTPEQTAAITHGGGELLLDAGAGSGKTAALLERRVRAGVGDGDGSHPRSLVHPVAAPPGVQSLP
jgi:ATP-dependent exoDNAse (exonuclease V) beta subunit